MAKNVQATERRLNRVRRSIKKAANGRPRLSVLPLVEADLRADHRRREGRHPGRRFDAREGSSRADQDGRHGRGSCGDRQADCSAGCRGRREGRRVRSRRLHLSRPRQGAGRRSPRRRSGFLRSSPARANFVFRGRSKRRPVLDIARDGRRSRAATPRGGFPALDPVMGPTITLGSSERRSHDDRPRE